MRKEKVRKDGACLECVGERPDAAKEHGDPFCTTECAKAYHGVAFTVKK